MGCPYGVLFKSMQIISFDAAHSIFSAYILDLGQGTVTGVVVKDMQH
jgi:hypothetical protein